MVTRGRVRLHDVLLARVEAPRRQAIALNHTGTHMLHATLRQVFGDHVKQAGSLVAPDRLRFDFTHSGRLPDREIFRIEEMVNERVREDRPIEVAHGELHDALKMGALAFFGDKYGDEVRIIKIGDYSLELCGGTHLHTTGEIGLFKVTQVSGVAAGVRRIEALTGAAAFEHVRREEATLNEVRDLLKAQPFEEPGRVQRLLEHVRDLEREVDTLKGRLTSARTQDLGEAVVNVQGVNVLRLQEHDLEAKDLRRIGGSRQGTPALGRDRGRLNRGWQSGIGRWCHDRPHPSVCMPGSLPKRWRHWWTAAEAVVPTWRRRVGKAPKSWRQR